jgi:hypothetical protein
MHPKISNSLLIKSPVLENLNLGAKNAKAAVQSHFQGTRKAPQATVAKYRDAETKVK